MSMRLILALLLCMVGSPAIAEQPNSDRRWLVGLKGFAMIEGNAFMASGDPKVYGVLGAALFPLAADISGDKKISGTLELLAAESLAFYNILELSGDQYDEDGVFEKNMLAWHLFAASSLLASTLIDQLDNQPQLNFLNRLQSPSSAIQISYTPATSKSSSGMLVFRKSFS